MKAATGQDFAVQRGAGLGVESGAAERCPLALHCLESGKRFPLDGAAWAQPPQIRK